MRARCTRIPVACSPPRACQHDPPSRALNAAHKPWWVTETGYHTVAQRDLPLYQPGVSEPAQGEVHAAASISDYFNAGISHTAVYEMVDERVDGNNATANYGLLHNDGSPKPRYTALKNLWGFSPIRGQCTRLRALAYSLRARRAPSGRRFSRSGMDASICALERCSDYDTRAKRDTPTRPSR